MRQLAIGMGDFQRRSFRFPSFIRTPIRFRKAAHDSPASEFAHASFFSFLFPLRAPSETLILMRALSSEFRRDFSPKTEKDPNCVRRQERPPFPISESPPGEEFGVGLRPASPLLLLFGRSPARFYLSGSCLLATH